MKAATNFGSEVKAVRTAARRSGVDISGINLPDDGAVHERVPVPIEPPCKGAFRHGYAGIYAIRMPVWFAAAFFAILTTGANATSRGSIPVEHGVCSDSGRMQRDRRV